MVQACGQRIVWTNHAVQRAMRRFAFEPPRQIPTRRITDEAREKSIGEEWKVRDSGAVYVCVKEWNAIVVVTVWKAKRTAGKRLSHQRRMREQA